MGVAVQVRGMPGLLAAVLCVALWCLWPGASRATFWTDPDCDGDTDGRDLWVVAAGCSGEQGSCDDALPGFAAAFGNNGGTEDAEHGVGSDEQEGGGGLVGRWVRLTIGNAVERREDVGFSSPFGSGFSLGATYNSRSDRKGALGWGWTHTYEVRLDKGPGMSPGLRVLDETGRAHYFRETETPGVYEGVLGSRGRVTEDGEGYTWHRHGGKSYRFTEEGILSEVRDEAGNRLRLSYDPEGRLGEVADESTGRRIIFHYNTKGLLEQVEGPETDAVPTGVWVIYAYDASGNLTSVTYAEGSGVDYEYQDPHDAHNLTEKRDLEGRVLGSWWYDAADRCTQHYTPGFGSIRIDYPTETLVEVRDGYGTTRSYTVGRAGGRRRLLQVTGPCPARYTDSRAVGWEYDEKARLTEVRFPTGLVNRYGEFDERGNPGTVILAAGSPEQRVIHLTYHPQLDTPLSLREASVLAQGGYKETVWDYDEDYNDAPNESPTGRVHRVVEKGYTANAYGEVIPYTYTTTLSWNDKGQLLAIDGPLAGEEDTAWFSYDPETADLLSITRPLVGSRTFGAYDASGRPGTITDENGHKDVLTYDGRGRVVKILHEADASTQAFTYDRGGLLTQSMDEDGVVSSLEYDPETGRVVKRTDAMGNFITYGYDAQGNLTEKGYHDPEGQMTRQQRWSYDYPRCPGLL